MNQRIVGGVNKVKQKCQRHPKTLPEKDTQQNWIHFSEILSVDTMAPDQSTENQKAQITNVRVWRHLMPADSARTNNRKFTSLILTCRQYQCAMIGYFMKRHFSKLIFGYSRDIPWKITAYKLTNKEMENTYSL